MSEERVEGVKVRETGGKQWEADYTQSDIEVVLSRGDWQSWDEAIQWLEEFGEEDNELTPGEAVAMAQDLRELRDQGEPYSSDPEEVFNKAHQYRADYQQEEDA